jgi:ribose transport system ATP-binding protein
MINDEAAGHAPELSATAAPLFELRGICKNFPGVKALDQVSFAVWPGEVHMLLGENGAGKSTLMKVLCGAYRADEGEFFYHGERVSIQSPADAKRFGIAVIFQEFSLVPYLDIAQNIFLGREFASRIPGLIDKRCMPRQHACFASSALTSIRKPPFTGWVLLSSRWSRSPRRSRRTPISL